MATTTTTTDGRVTPPNINNPELLQEKDVHTMSASDLAKKGIPLAHKAEVRSIILHSIVQLINMML
jgi:hypothetical protein